MAEKRDSTRSHESSKGEAAKSTKKDEKDSSGGPETVEFVYTFNRQTGQVMKIEELDPETNERKEVPMAAPSQPYAYDPYGYGSGYQEYGYDPYGGYGGYGSYGYDPYGGYGGT